MSKGREEKRNMPRCGRARKESQIPVATGENTRSNGPGTSARINRDEEFDCKCVCLYETCGPASENRKRTVLMGVKR